MADAFFLKKKTRRAFGNRISGASQAASASSTPPPPRPARPVRPPPPGAAGPGPSTATAAAAVKAESTPPASTDHLVEIQIVSADPDSGLRFNLMKMNSTRDVDPSHIPSPILLNRKQPGPKQPPQFQFDESGNIVGRFVYDEEGKPVLDDEGNPKVEKRSEMDMSLVGMAPGQANKRRGKRSTKEVFHQDLEVIKLRREEANPWVLEAKNPSENATALPEHWVGRMMEPSSLPTVLLINEGEGASFTMVPLGRTYRFNPERPFKVMDADPGEQYELQTKYKIHDRWGQRQESSGPGFVKPEPSSHVEDRAQRMEWNIMHNKGEVSRPTAKREAFEDDYVREGRNIGRGLEGGVDEELDYDANEDFQDDEDSNTFYFNKEEDEEKKLLEEKQKKEYRWANANVGDRPQIEDDGDDDDDDDLFAEKLNREGRRLRKMMRKRGEEEGELYDSSDDDDDDSDSDDEGDDKAKDVPGSAEKPSRHGSRAGSRAPDGRGGSPSRRTGPPTPERAGSLPGAGAALLAKRAASRAGSPSLRASSPLARGASPELGRGGSPAPNGRSGSPSLTRGGSPAPGAREGTPSGTAAAPRPKSKSAKRKATSESPLRDTAPPASMASATSGKRKSPEDSASNPGTPRVSSPAGDAPAAAKKKKKSRASSGSATPAPFEGDSFVGMITSDDVLSWLRQQPSTIPMGKAIQAFAKKIPAGDNTKKNQDLFLHWIRTFTDKVEGKVLRLKAEYA